MFSIADTCWLYFLLPGATLALLSFLVLDGPVATARDAISTVFSDLAARLTDLTTAPWILTVSGLTAVIGSTVSGSVPTWRGRYRALNVSLCALYVFTSVLVASSTVNVVKRLIGRARPDLFSAVGDFHFSFGRWTYDYASFPSGHSTTAGAVFMAFGLLFPRFRPLFVCLGIAFGFARIAVGAHYPSDVSAGLFYGAWIAVITACLFARYRLLFDAGNGALPRQRL